MTIRICGDEAMRQPLKDLAAICAGQGAPQGNHNYCENGTPFIKAGNLQELLEGKAITSIQKVSDEVAKKHKLRLYPKGTILFAKSGMSCIKGYIYVLPQSAYVVSHLACITPNEDISEYLRYYFNYHKPNQLVKDAAYPSISLSDVGNLVVDMKPESERNEIVSVLQHTESIITLRQQQLQKLNELVKARFVELFGDLKSNPMEWPVVPFTEFAKIDGNMTTDYEKYADYPHIGIDSIEKGTGALKGYRTVREDGVISGKYIFTPQHIIYSKIRPNLNKVALPDFEGLCSADAYPILPNRSNCNRVFLAIALRSEYFLEYILQFSSRTNLPKVNRKEITGFRMPLPPLKLQEQFAAFVEQTDKSKVAVQKALDEAQLLFDSLMQKYFGDGN